MLSLTVSQRVVPRQPTISRRIGSRMIYHQRAAVLKVKCYQEAAEVPSVEQTQVADQDITEGGALEIQDVSEQPIVDTNGEDNEQQQEEVVEQQQESGSELVNFFKEQMDPEVMLGHLKEHEHNMQANSVAIVASNLRKIVADYKDDLKQNQEAALPLEAVKECYDILVRTVRSNMESFRFTALSNIVWSLALARDVIQIHEQIEGYSEVMDKLFAQAAKLCEDDTMGEYSLLKLTRLMRFLGTYLHEDNRKHMDVLFQKLQTFKDKKFDARESIDVIRILRAMEVTDLEILDRFVPRMARKHFKERKLVFMTVFASQLAEMRYYDAQFLSTISQYLQTGSKSKHGSVMAMIAKYVATLATASDNRQKLAELIAEVGIQKEDSYWTPDFILILNYIAQAGCPEEQYKTLMNILLQKLGGDYSELSIEDLYRLRQAQLFQSSNGVTIEFPEELEAMCMRAQSDFVDGVVSAINQDQFTQDVFYTIQLQYQDAQCAAAVADGEVAVPILVERNGVQVVIHPVTEKQYVLNAPNRLLESVKAEYSILESLGYQVQKVKSQKWYEDNDYKDSVMYELSERLNGTFVETEETEEEVAQEVVVAEAEAEASSESESNTEVDEQQWQSPGTSPEYPVLS
eukprot:TRINITY_DN190_c0_g2_i2.p1 TRINITY_DN190_c0_g2~~TRINITY_DN190_c0_g2_i2.p1  ORF type:complete len:658 (-),score=93.45 TRINITY_DN190_c0_g2_i2:300-2195(-)